MALLKDHIVTVLDNMKAEDIIALNVNNLTTLTDEMIIASGNSERHTKALAKKVIDEIWHLTKIYPQGVEGLEDAQWILLDYNECIVHIMKQESRDYYALEKLWSDVGSNLAVA